MGMLVIGVGNTYRGDDGAGPAVVAMLRAKKLPSVRLLESDGDCTGLLDAWQNVGVVIVIDAASSNAPPGTLYCFDALSQPLPRDISFHSTHAFGLSEAIALGRTLGQLPASLLLYAIEGKTFATGVGLSQEVELAVREVVLRVERDPVQCNEYNV